MARALSIGDTVAFRLFNSVDKHFHGPVFEGTLLDTRYVNYSEEYWREEYKIGGENFKYWGVGAGGFIWVKRKEILRRIK